MGGSVHERRGRERSQARAPGSFDELRGGLTDAEARGEEVGLAPEHALGHAGGAPGVEDVEVVGAQTLGRSGIGARQRGLVVDRPGKEGSGGVVADLQEQGRLR